MGDDPITPDEPIVIERPGAEFLSRGDKPKPNGDCAPKRSNPHRYIDAPEDIRLDEELRQEQGARRPEAPPIGEPIGKQKPNFRSLAQFCAEFRPISYAVAGLMREGSLYTLTGRTGEGKTALLVKLALAVVTGRGEEMIGRKVKKGRVAFATAENPDDLRMRLMVACFALVIDPETIGRDLLISDNRVAPEDIVDWIKETGEAFTLIIIDTWQAYFDGKDPNNNAEAVSFTRRFRPLAKTNGQPVVIIAAHPPKQAKDDSLLPYGGGGTLNEIDGNFTLRRDESGLYCFHWLGKIRGLPFDPIHFRVDKLDSPDVVTVESVRVQMPVMFAVDEEAVEARGEALAKRDLALLKAIADDPAGSERKWAVAINNSRRVVSLALERFERDRLVTKKARRWRLTKDGESVAQGQS
jgi:KaiC/GvpD/RAD55 family RecA-like ATPase